METFFWTVTLPALVTIFGWAVTYETTIRKAEQKRRTNDYLIEAFQLIHNASGRDPSQLEYMRQLERGLSLIQLLGSPEEIKLAAGFLDRVHPNTVIPIDELLNSLKTRLRRDLDLEAVEGNVRTFRAP